MKTEIEVKFLKVDIEEIRARLAKAGAHLEHPMRLMRRALIETDEMKARHAYLRIRDEGNKVTATYKQFTENSLTGAKEREIVVSDFNETIAIFEEFGLRYHTFQESKRETWKFKEAEVVIDEWPWIAPYIEIEGNSADIVTDAAKALGFNWTDAVFGSVDVIYNMEFPDMSVRGVIDIQEVRFDQPSPVEFGAPRNG